MGKPRARTQSAKVAARTPRSLRIAFFLMIGSSGSSGMGVAGISRYCLIQNARCRDVGPRRALWVNPIDRLADLFEPEVTRGIGWTCVALGSARPPLPDFARNPFQWCKTLKFLRCHALSVFGERPEPDTVCGPATQVVTSERVQEVFEDAGTPQDWAETDGSLDGFQAVATRSTLGPPQPMPRAVY